MMPINRYTCEDTFRRLEDYVDRELTPQETVLVEQHLETCAACAAEFAFQASMLDELRRRVRRIDLPTDLFERVSTRLAAIRIEKEGDGGQPAGEHSGSG